MKKHFSNSYQGAIDHFVSRAVEFILPCLIPSDSCWSRVPFPPLCLSPGHILLRMPLLIGGANADIMCWTGVFGQKVHGRHLFHGGVEWKSPGESERTALCTFCSPSQTVPGFRRHLIALLTQVRLQPIPCKTWVFEIRLPFKRRGRMVIIQSAHYPQSVVQSDVPANRVTRLCSVTPAAAVIRVLFHRVCGKVWRTTSCKVAFYIWDGHHEGQPKH